MYDIRNKNKTNYYRGEFLQKDMKKATCNGRLSCIVLCAMLGIIAVFITGCANTDEGTNVMNLAETAQIIRENTQVESRENTEIDQIESDVIGESYTDIDTNLGVKLQDVRSIWFDGVEFKILKYLDDDSMLVKFPLGDYLIQAVVPRSLEEENYISEYYIEYDSSGNNTEVYLILVNMDKSDSFRVAYVQGPDSVAGFRETYEELHKQIDNETIYEISTLNNGTGIVLEDSDRIGWSEYDQDKEWLSGYTFTTIEQEERMAFVMQMLYENESESEAAKKNFEQVVFRKIEDNDFVLWAESEQTDYDVRMDNMYQKYREIVRDSTKYLQENYEVPGENYELHYLFDLTEDAIPEIIFLGTPRWICIVGEMNAVSLSGSEIFLTNEPDVFYTKIAFQEDVTWSKYKIEKDSQGYITANLIETLGSSAGGAYSLGKENITEEEFLSKLSEIERVDRPIPKLYDTEEYVAAKGGFNKSVRYLNNDLISELY